MTTFDIEAATRVILVVLEQCI